LQIKERDANDWFKTFKSLEKQMIIIGKPLEMIKAVHRFRKSDLRALWNSASPRNQKDSSSKLLTMVHGDFWSNNIFVNQDRSQVHVIYNFHHTEFAADWHTIG
jgi:thiamine kinase-like enzyme